jgi:hypothetical protein
VARTYLSAGPIGWGFHHEATCSYGCRPFPRRARRSDVSDDFSRSPSLLIAARRPDSTALAGAHSVLAAIRQARLGLAWFGLAWLVSFGIREPTLGARNRHSNPALKRFHSRLIFDPTLRNGRLRGVQAESRASSGAVGIARVSRCGGLDSERASFAQPRNSFLAQRRASYLARIVAQIIVSEFVAFRHFVLGDPIGEEALKIRRIQSSGRVPFWLNNRVHTLTHLGVRQADCDGRGHTRVRVKRSFYLGRIYVGTATKDQICAAVCDIDVTLLVHPAHVADRFPAAFSLRGLST